MHPYPFTPYFYFSISNYHLLINHSCPYISVGYWFQDPIGIPKSTNAQVPWLSYHILRTQIHRFIKPPIGKLVQNLAGWICGWQEPKVIEGWLDTIYFLVSIKNTRVINKIVFLIVLCCIPHFSIPGILQVLNMYFYNKCSESCISLTCDVFENFFKGFVFLFGGVMFSSEVCLLLLKTLP